MDEKTRADFMSEYVSIQIELHQFETDAEESIGYKPDSGSGLFLALYETLTKPLIRKRNALHKLLFGEDYTEPPYEGNRD